MQNNYHIPELLPTTTPTQLISNTVNPLDEYITPSTHAIDPSTYTSSLINDKLLLKETISKIITSLAALNIQLPPSSLTNLIQTTNHIIDHVPTSSLLTYITLLCDIITSLLVMIKKDFIMKDELTRRLHAITSTIDDYTHKISSLKKDIVDKDKTISSLITKHSFEIDKIQLNKKAFNNEIAELKNENKKLTNLISLYKHEVRKKENETQQILDKYKNIVNKQNHIKHYDNTTTTTSSSNMLYITETIKTQTQNVDNVVYVKNVINECSAQFNKEMLNVNEYLLMMLKGINDKVKCVFSELNGGGTMNHKGFKVIKSEVFYYENFINECTRESIWNDVLQNLNVIITKVEEMNLKYKQLKNNVKRNESSIGFKFGMLSNVDMEEYHSHNRKAHTKVNSKWFENIQTCKAEYKLDKDKIVLCDSSFENDECNSNNNNNNSTPPNDNN